MKVVVANGDIVECSRFSRQFKWSMHGQPFATDVFLIALENYHMVLGVQWLITLGNILWNFKDLTMQFTRTSVHIKRGKW